MLASNSKMRYHAADVDRFCYWCRGFVFCACLLLWDPLSFELVLALFVFWFVKVGSLPTTILFLSSGLE